MNEEPTNRELMHYIKDINNNVAEIKVQTTKTNGRVGILENRWAFISGGLAVLTVLVLPILFIVIKWAIDK